MAAKPNRAPKGPRMIKEILRLHEMGLGSERIAQALSISRNTVRRYIRKHKLALAEGTPPPLHDALSPPASKPYEAPWAGLVDWTVVKRRTQEGVQLRHFWEEEIQSGDGIELKTVSYVSFWREYKRRFPAVALDFHKEFPPGDRCEADYKGEEKGFGFYDPIDGRFVQCQLFGNILAFSQLSYVEATLTQKQSDFLSAFANSFKYFGGVPALSVVDNAKVGVSKAHRYDPDFNPEFTYFCEHFDTGHIAAVAGKPKHKCFIENMLGVFWRWAGPKVRKRRFASLTQLNAFLAELVGEFNNRVQKKYGMSRRQKFEGAERAKLGPLPAKSFQIATWKQLKPHPDCHIQIGHNYYSVPFQLRGKAVEVRLTGQFAEVFFNLERVALHLLFSGNQAGRYQTKDSHLPPAHMAMKEFTPARALQDAEAIGPMTLKVVDDLFGSAKHPLVYLRRIQGILRLANRYSKDKVEDASKTIVGLGVSLPRFRDFEVLVRNANDKAAGEPKISRGPNPNLRGQASFDGQSQ